MSKYRNKPVVIEAYRFTGSSTSSWKIKEWMDGGLCPEPGGMQTADMCNCEIETLEGTMKARPGDWIVRGVQGEFYPVRADIFEQTYEAVEDAEATTQPEGGDDE